MSDRKWDTSKGRKWVVVAFWGVETTVDFHEDQVAANKAYANAVEQGADAFYATTTEMRMQADPETEFTPSGFLSRDIKRARASRSRSKARR